MAQVKITHSSEAPKQTPTTGITEEKLKKFHQMAEEAPHTQQELQKITDELKTLILKGYSRIEIMQILQRAEIKEIEQTALYEKIAEIKKELNPPQKLIFTIQEVITEKQK